MNTQSEKSSIEINSDLQSHGIRIVESMTTPSRPGKKPRPVWVVSGNTFGLDSFFYEIGGKKYRGAWSFFKNPSGEILEEVNTNGRMSFADQVDAKLGRKEARIEKFEAYSENAEARSSAAYQKAHAVSSMIPMGQPILVGHHSENRHRRDLRRIDSGMRKSIEESKKADYYSSKVSSLSYEVKRARESRKYIGNRIEETKRELNSIERWLEVSISEASREAHQVRKLQASEKLSFWQGRLQELEREILEAGGQIASSETIKVGDEIYYSGWLPVVRVNKKTVTVSNWLGVSTLQYKIEYCRIQKFRTPNKT